MRGSLCPVFISFPDLPALEQYTDLVLKFNNRRTKDRLDSVIHSLRTEGSAGFSGTDVAGGSVGSADSMHSGRSAWGQSVATTLQMAMKWMTLAMITMMWKNSWWEKIRGESLGRSFTNR